MLTATFQYGAPFPFQTYVVHGTVYHSPDDSIVGTRFDDIRLMQSRFGPVGTIITMIAARIRKTESHIDHSFFQQIALNLKYLTVGRRMNGSLYRHTFTANII